MFSRLSALLSTLVLATLTGSVAVAALDPAQCRTSFQLANPASTSAEVPDNDQPYIINYLYDGAACNGIVFAPYLIRSSGGTAFFQISTLDESGQIGATYINFETNTVVTNADLEDGSYQSFVTFFTNNNGAYKYQGAKNFADIVIEHEMPAATPSGGGITNVKRARRHNCPLGQSYCSVAGGFECVDARSDIESCGGCIGSPYAQDCTALDGVLDVACRLGICQVSTCDDGFVLAQDGRSCNPEN